MYKLPEARSSLHDSWSGCELRGFVPNANQQLVIDVVRSALDAGLYYTRDVRDHCARAIGLNVRISVFLDIQFGTVDTLFGTAISKPH